MKQYVLDSSALIGFLEGRPGSDKVEQILVKAAEAKRPVLISSASWGEVYFALWRSDGHEVAEQRLRQIDQLPIEVVELDISTSQSAGRLAALCALSYASCLAAGLAERKKAILVTADRAADRMLEYVNVLLL